MFSFPAEISQDLLQKFSRDEALRAVEYVEVYLFFKSTAEHVKVLGPRFALAQEAIAIDLAKVTACVKERSLLGYCNEVFGIMAKPTDATVGTGVGFLVVDYGEAKNVNESSLVSDSIVEKLKSLPYVKEINLAEVGTTHAMFVSYNKAGVPEGESFSVTAGAIDGISGVRKVV